MSYENRTRSKTVMKNCKIQVLRSSDSFHESDPNKSSEIQEGFLKPQRYAFDNSLKKGLSEVVKDDYYSVDKSDDPFHSSNSRFYVNVIPHAANFKNLNQDFSSFNREAAHNTVNKERSDAVPSKHRLTYPDHSSKNPTDRHSSDIDKKSLEPIRRYTNLIRLPTKRKDQKRNTIISDTGLVSEPSPNYQPCLISQESIDEYRNFLKKAIKSSQSKRRIQAQNDLYSRYQNIINFIPKGFISNK